MADNQNAVADSVPGINNVQQPYNLLGNPNINMQNDMHTTKRLKTADSEYISMNYLHSGDLNSSQCPTVIDNNNLAHSQPNSIGQLNSTGVVINSQPTVVSHQPNTQQLPNPGQPQQPHILNSAMLPKSGNVQQPINAGRQLPNMIGHGPNVRPQLGGPQQQRLGPAGQMIGTIHNQPIQVISQQNNAQQSVGGGQGPQQQQFMNVNKFQQQPNNQMGHRIVQNPSGNVQPGQQQYRFNGPNMNHQPGVSIPQISGSQPNQPQSQMPVSQSAQGQPQKPNQAQQAQSQATGQMAFSLNSQNLQQNLQQNRQMPNVEGQGSYPLNTDNEKRKLIQQQLVLLLHAHKCQRREQQQQRLSGGEPIRPCALPHCPTMKNVLAHMVTCATGKNCTVAHCSSSKQIINHWKNCPRIDCPVCLPLKQANERRPADRLGGQALSIDGSGAGSLPVNIPTINLSSLPVNSAQLPNSRVIGPPQQSQTMNSLQGSQGPIMQQDMQRAYQILELPFNSQPNAINNSPFSNQASLQGWHSNVNTDLRKHLVQKIVQAIFPNHDQNADAQNTRVTNLYSYAEKVELDMYNKASSREEYYHLLAEKIYRIKKELEEKRQRRREQQAQMVHGPQGLGCPRPLMNNGVTSMRPQMMTTMSGTQSVPRMALAPNVGQQNNLGFNGPQNEIVQQQPQNQNNMSQFYMNNGNQNGSPSPGPVQPNVSTGPMQQSGPNFRTINTSANNSGFTISSTPSSTNTNGMPQQQLPQPNSGNSQNYNNNSVGVTSNLHNILSNNSTNGNQPTPQAQTQLNQTSQHSSPQFKNEFLGDGNIKTEVMPTEDILPSMSNCDSQSLTSTTNDFDKLSGQANNISNSFGDNALKQEEREDNSNCVKMEPSAGQVKVKPEPMSPPVNILPPLKSPKQEMMDSTATTVKPKTEAPSASETPVPAPARVKPKVFAPGELRAALFPIWDKLNKNEDSFPFRVPVDPHALNIPDYFNIIKKPMDLSTIKDKLEADQYEDAWGFTNDIWLMLENAWLYNRKTSKVYRCCSKLYDVFIQDIDPVMQSLGYCCGRKHSFQPQVLCCFGKQLCTIPRDSKYMVYKDRYTYCMKCFSDIPGDKVIVSDLSFDPTAPPTTTLNKTDFSEAKNDHVEYEQFVTCKDCRRKLHQICVVHYEPIWPEGFTCEHCLSATIRKKSLNRFTAKRLPITKLGSFLENRVNNFLRKKECGAGDVSIRVVSSSDKMVEVRPGMKTKYCDEGLMNESFPYKAKALFAFEEIDGTDVCFFGMHVQEYGSECAQPNHRRVYIAYLDSVYYFRPKQYRTAVYHEILLGYLDYAKQLGYTMAHIWACPPSEGDDYIFHCHPTEQKIPKPKRLQEWYKKMLDKGIIERIVLDYKDILKQATEDNMKTAAELPYFEGDFWPNVLEESIKEIEQEQAKQQNEKSDTMMDEDSNDNFDPDDTDNSKSKEKNKKNNSSKKSSKKQNSRKNNSNSRAKGGLISNQNSQLTPTQQFDANLAGKVYATMEKHKEVFFVVRLHSSQSAASLPSINDPDPLMACELMDGRDAFLTLARDKHYEFSSLRRCKFSTMAMLYELHTNGNERFMYTCNNCKRSMGEARYHCSQCDDFDLCISCYNSEGHPHPMERIESNDPVLTFGVSDGGFGDSGPSSGDADNSGESGSSNPAENRKNTVQRCVDSLVHANQCRDANCRRPLCIKLKRVIQHTKSCKRKSIQDGPQKCTVCRQLISICCFHAKQCEDNKCPMPYCLGIKQRIKAQQMQQRLRTAQIVSRRIASMAQTNYGSNASSTTSNSNDQYISNSKPGPSVEKATPPPPGALHAAQQAQQVAQRQQNLNNSYGKGGGGGGKGGGGKNFPYSGSNAGGGKGGPQMNSNHVQGHQQQWFGSQQGSSQQQQQGGQQMMMRTQMGGKPQSGMNQMGQQQGGMHMQNNSLLAVGQHGGNNVNFSSNSQQNMNNDGTILQTQQQQRPPMQLETLLMQLKSPNQNNLTQSELMTKIKSEPALMSSIIKMKQQQQQQNQQQQQARQQQMGNNQQVMGQPNQMQQQQQNHNANQQWNAGNQYQQQGQSRMMNPRGPFQQNPRQMMPHQMGNTIQQQPQQQQQQQQQGGQQMFVQNQGQQRYWNSQQQQQNMQQGPGGLMRGGPQVMRSPPNQMAGPRMGGPRFGMQNMGQNQQDQEMMMYQQQQQQQQDFSQINQPELTNQD